VFTDQRKYSRPYGPDVTLMTSVGMSFSSWSAKKSCFNCNDWLTFRDERHTLAYESLRWLTTIKESTRIINLLSRFDYLIMLTSSLFYIKRSRLYINCIRYSLVKMRPQHAASMAHQEVFQQQIIINQLIRWQLTMGRGARVRRIFRRSRLHPKRRANWLYYQLKVEEKKIIELSKNHLQSPK